MAAAKISVLMRVRSWIAIVLLTAPPRLHSRKPPQTRAEALSALRHADAATRAEAVAWLATRGGMEDAGLLHERLRDESSFVRNYAEQGLWLLWSRSGDADIDRLMARHRGDARRALRRSGFGVHGRDRKETRVRRGLEPPRDGPLPRRRVSTSRSPTATKC